MSGVEREGGGGGGQNHLKVKLAKIRGVFDSVLLLL